MITGKARTAVRSTAVPSGMPILADDDVIVHGPSGPAMSMIAFIIWMSACDGVGMTLRELVLS